MVAPSAFPGMRAENTLPDITVLICTRNRAAQLRRALGSAARMDVPRCLLWELVVVDNGSADDTEQVALEYSDRLPIRVVREEAPGLSHARNRGVSEAQGRYICWTDDDVVLDRNWLAAYASAFERHPEAVVFGGRIKPILEPPSPAWFLRFADVWPLTTVLAHRDFGASPAPLDLKAGVIPWGANYAVRSAEQRKVQYEPSLGVSPRQRRLAEETEAIYQIMKPGAYGWWVPDAIVEHIIPRRRQTLSYVFDYFTSYGETLSHLEATRPGGHHLSDNQSELRKLRSGILVSCLLVAVHTLMFAAAWLSGATRRSLHFLMRAGFYAGVAAESKTRRAAAKHTASRPSIDLSVAAPGSMNSTVGSAARRESASTTF